MRVEEGGQPFDAIIGQTMGLRDCVYLVQGTKKGRTIPSCCCFFFFFHFTPCFQTILEITGTLVFLDTDCLERVDNFIVLDKCFE